MQAAKPVQTGGLDPGLAALVAAIFSGSITAYGVSKDTRSKEDRIREELMRGNEERFKAVEEAEKKKDELTSAATTATKKIADLEAEVATLKKRNMELESSASTFTKSNETFKNASSDVLKAAAPLVIQKLSSKYAWVQPETPNLKKALLYPTEYAGRLARMSLYDFYQKRVAPAMEKDMKSPTGGRRRYRRRARGGTDTPAETAAKVATLSEDKYAPVVSAETKADTESFLNDEYAPEVGESSPPLVVPSPSPEPVTAVAAEPPRLTSIPPYEDFALAYTKAIEEATKNMPTARQVYNEKLKTKREGVAEGKRIAAETKAEKAALDAAGAMARKISRAIDDAKKEIAKQEKTADSSDPTVSSVKKELDTLLEEATLISTVPSAGSPEKHSDLSLYVATSRVDFSGAPGTYDTTPKWVATWNEKKPVAEKVLADIPALVKKYTDAVKKASKAQPKAAEPAVAPVEDTFSVTNPLLAPKEEAKPEPAAEEAVPVTQEKIDVINPLFVGETGKTPAQLLANPLRVGQVLKGDAATAPARKALKKGMSFFTPKQNPLTQRKPRKGGSRKRTLKKRRGGK